MQLECSDGSVAHSVGLQSTRVVVLAVGGVRERRLRRVGVSAGASLDGQVQLRRGPLSFADYGCDPTISRGLGHVVCGIEGTGRNRLRPNRRRADGEAGIANT